VAPCPGASRSSPCVVSSPSHCPSAGSISHSVYKHFQHGTEHSADQPCPACTPMNIPACYTLHRQSGLPQKMAKHRVDVPQLSVLVSWSVQSGACSETALRNHKKCREWEAKDRHESDDCMKDSHSRCFLDRGLEKVGLLTYSWRTKACLHGHPNGKDGVDSRAQS
jgi:hypothetical protein